MDGESFEEAAIREVTEECGYQVSLGKLIYQSFISSKEYKGSRNDTDEIELVIFEGKIISGKLKIDDQALDLKWLTREEIAKLPLRWDLLKKLILAN